MGGTRGGASGANAPPARPVRPRRRRAGGAADLPRFFDRPARGARPVTHTARVPVRWGDLDSLGHLNNAVYLTLCEQARIEALGALDATDWDDAGPVVVAASLRYLRPITTPGVARVTVAFGEPGRTSLPTTHTVALDGADELAAEAEVTLVWVDHATGRPTPVPDALRARLREAGEAER